MSRCSHAARCSSDPICFHTAAAPGRSLRKTLGHKMRPVFLIFYCVAVQFDSVPPTAGWRRAAPSGCPRAGTSVGRAKKKPPEKNKRGPSCLGADVATPSQAHDRGARRHHHHQHRSSADIPVYDVTVSRAKDTGFLLICRWLHLVELDAQTVFSFRYLCKTVRICHEKEENA